MRLEKATVADADNLADLRARAMRESLIALGRYDPIRVRDRFLRDYSPEETTIIYCAETLLGFFTLVEKTDHFYLSHLYVDCRQQGRGVGSAIMAKIVQTCDKQDKPIRLGALKKSRSNAFYRSHGFKPTHEGPYDNYYERKCTDR